MARNSNVIVKRQKVKICFNNGDMDFTFNWILGAGVVIGLSHGELFYAASKIKDGDPESWVSAFREHGHYLSKQALQFEQSGFSQTAGQSRIAAAYAYRASLHYADPTSSDFMARVAEMETALGTGIDQTHIPMRSIEVPFEGAMLPGYFLEIDHTPRPTLVTIGGADTFREDLLYFGGLPGWRRNYNVLMVDLPGQGKTPTMGLFMARADMAPPIAAALDWLERNAPAASQSVALYGLSGGGLFTAQAAASDPRIKAWIASTPIIDIAKVFHQEFGAVMRAPGWAMSLILRGLGKFNEGLNRSLKKYAWQFGVSDFKEVIVRSSEVPPVDPAQITCPSLFLMGQSEAEELKRQTIFFHDALQKRGVDVTLHEFVPADGADAHCQINNLSLAHRMVFDWLDRHFNHSGPGSAE